MKRTWTILNILLILLVLATILSGGYVILLIMTNNEIGILYDTILYLLVLIAILDYIIIALDSIRERKEKRRMIKDGSCYDSHRHYR